MIAVTISENLHFKEREAKGTKRFIWKAELKHRELFKCTFSPHAVCGSFGAVWEAEPGASLTPPQTTLFQEFCVWQDVKL